MKKTKISDLKLDQRNFNKGTAYGNSLIEKSLRKFGAGRSILIDRNGNVIAGNKTLENAAAIGMEDVQIIETDGKKIIAVKRMDIDLDSPEGRELALADNATAKSNIDFDTELIEETIEEEILEEEVFEEWGVKLKTDYKEETNEAASEYKYYLLSIKKEHLPEVESIIKELGEKDFVTITEG